MNLYSPHVFMLLLLLSLFQFQFTIQKRPKVIDNCITSSLDYETRQPHAQCYEDRQCYKDELCHDLSCMCKYIKCDEHRGSCPHGTYCTEESHLCVLEEYMTELYGGDMFWPSVTRGLVEDTRDKLEFIDTNVNFRLEELSRKIYELRIEADSLSKDKVILRKEIDELKDVLNENFYFHILLSIIIIPCVMFVVNLVLEKISLAKLKKIGSKSE